MLYRIAIYKIVDGKRVFDHYASDEEMENLKVSPDGKVWHYQFEEFIINPITGLPVYRIINTDFSDTHEVEWGFEKDGKEYYENSIYRHSNQKEISGDYRSATGVFDLLTMINNYAGEIACVGNIHEEEK